MTTRQEKLEFLNRVITGGFNRYGDPSMMSDARVDYWYNRGFHMWCSMWLENLSVEGWSNV